MLKNTIDVSLTLYSFIIVLVIVGFIFLIREARRNSDSSKLSTLADYFKWSIASVAIIIASNIVVDNFKERGQDVQELEYFHTYANDVKRTDGLSERFRLVQYLATVAPAGPMLDAWIRYLRVVESEMIKVDSIKVVIQPLQKLDGLHEIMPNQKARLDSLNEVINAIERPIFPGIKDDESSYRLILGTDVTLEAAQGELEKALQIDERAVIFQQDGKYVTAIETPNMGMAKKLLAKSKTKFNTSPFIVKRD